jgi:hypothetical protein
MSIRVVERLTGAVRVIRENVADGAEGDRVFVQQRRSEHRAVMADDKPGMQKHTEQRQ